MDPLEVLLAIESIKSLKARYFRCMDTKSWGDFAAQFTPDALMDVSGEMRGSEDPEAGMIRGNDKIAAFVREMIGDVVTVHHGHTPEIEITSPTTARGVWAMEDKLQWPDGSPLGSLHGYGHYHETYEKIDGRWLIESTRLTRLRLDFGTTPGN